MTDIIVLVSSWVNHPEMLKIHRDIWLQAFPSETVRYVAYIDAKDYADPSNFNDPSMRLKLINECIKHNIEYYIIPEELHLNKHIVIPNCQIAHDMTPSARDVLVCHFAWKQLVLDEPSLKRIGLIQPDMFPYRKVNWSDITRGSDFYYKSQERDGLIYAWNGLCLFSMNTWAQELKEIVDFQCGFQKGVYTDSGGGLWKLLEVLPESNKFRWTGHNSLQWNSNDTKPELPFWIMEHLRMDPRNIETDGKILYYSEIQDNWSFHLRAGCNWDNVGKEIHDTRYSNLLRLLTDAINDGTVFLE